MIIHTSSNNSNRRGAVSLFIVVFTALLMMVITVSFVQLMTSDQRQATNGDLSQSAYDSAQAGVEDAKRLLLVDKACQDGTAGALTDCVAVASALTPPRGEKYTRCDTLTRAGLVPETNNETLIQQQDDDNKLDQGYTCVKILSDTDDYRGSLDQGVSPVLIPLKGTDSVSKIVISWGINRDGGPVDLDSNDNLPPLAAWPQDRPALLRAQLINGRGSFRLSDFDRSGFSNTLFLYPSSVGSDNANFVNDSRQSPARINTPRLILCDSGAGRGAFVCRVTLTFAAAIGAKSETAFLSLDALYNSTDFKIELMNGNGRVVPFDGVQPKIDSTGRANDLFRRVEARVELGGNFNYPKGLEVKDDLCKNFLVTNDDDDYRNNCTP